MKQIRKYCFVRGRFEDVLAEDADFLSVQAQGEMAVLYVAESPDAKKRKRTFQAYHTGDLIEPGQSYIGTAMTSNGAYVLHLFEITQPA